MARYKGYDHLDPFTYRRVRRIEMLRYKAHVKNHDDYTWYLCDLALSQWVHVPHLLKAETYISERTKRLVEPFTVEMATKTVEEMIALDADLLVEIKAIEDTYGDERG